MYCTYLTIIWHPTLGTLYYAGKSNLSKRVPGVNYSGSCKIPLFKLWLSKYPHATRILSVFESREEESNAESQLILKCLRKHGAYLHNRLWLRQFGPGSCLNGHWGGGCITSEFLELGHSTEARKKASASLSKRFQEGNNHLLSSITAETRQKQWEARSSHSTTYRLTMPDGSTYEGTQAVIQQAVSSVHINGHCANLICGKCSSPHTIRRGPLAGATLELLTISDMPIRKSVDHTKSIESRKERAAHVRVTAPDGSVYEGCCSELQRMLNLQVRINGYIGALTMGRESSPYCPRKGALKGYKFELL